MGYVNPSKPEPRGFDDQFEWDGHGWLFRRFHRARPVRVTAEEMDQSINFYESWSKRITFAAVGLWVLLSILWDVAGPATGPLSDRSVQGLGLLAFGAFIWAAKSWLWRQATDRFARRAPVGPGKGWLEDRQEQVRNMTWADLLAPMFMFVVAIFFLWPLDEAHWFEFAVAAIAALIILFDLGLKLLEARS